MFNVMYFPKCFIKLVKIALAENVTVTVGYRFRSLVVTEPVIETVLKTDI